MAQTVEDRFNRANASNLGTAWRIESGNIQVVDEAAQQQSGGVFNVNARAVHLTALDTPQQRVTAWVRLTGETGVPFVEVFARAKEDVVGSPFVTDNGYSVRLTRNSTGDTLSIHKLDSGASTQLASNTITLASPKDRLIPIQIVVEDAGGFVEVHAFIDDLATPRFSAIDRLVPLWRTIGSIGFNVFEGTAQTSQQVQVERFEAAAIDQETIEGPDHETHLLWDLDTMARHAQLRIDEGADSAVAADDVKRFLNFAEIQFVEQVGPANWWRRLFNVRSQANNRFLTLPPQASDNISSIIDITNGDEISEIDLKQLGARDQNRTTTIGTPRRYAYAGMDSFDRIRLELHPTPNSEIVYEVWSYALPGRMVNNTDRPMIPQQYVEAIIIGAVQRAAQLSGNGNLMIWNQAQYNRLLAAAKRAVNRAKNTFFYSGRSQPIRRARPLTRREQLGFFPT